MIPVSEQLTAQFYRWEQKGRGWQAFEEAIELEPHFHPFFFHYAPPPAIRVDDGRRHTLFSFIAEAFKNKPESQPEIDPYVDALPAGKATEAIAFSTSLEFFAFATLLIKPPYFITSLMNCFLRSTMSSLWCIYFFTSFFIDSGLPFTVSSIDARLVGAIMPAATDILLDKNGDLPIETNNFLIGLSDIQHVKDAMISFPGEWKQYPQNGIGIGAYQKARIDSLQVLAKIRRQLINDGYTLNNPQVYQDQYGTMVVEPNAIRL